MQDWRSQRKTDSRRGAGLQVGCEGQAWQAGGRRRRKAGRACRARDGAGAAEGRGPADGEAVRERSCAVSSREKLPEPGLQLAGGRPLCEAKGPAARPRSPSAGESRACTSAATCAGRGGQNTGRVALGVRLQPWSPGPGSPTSHSHGSPGPPPTKGSRMDGEGLCHHSC